MKKYIDFIDDFIYFCKEQEISEASAKSYIAYLNGAVKHFSWPLISLKQKMEQDKAETLYGDFNYLLVKIDEQKSFPAPSMSISKKTLSNYHSAIVAFIAYLEQQISTKKKRHTISAGKKITLSKEELIRIFRARITTQGRVYNDYVIPFRTYNHILHNNQAYKKLLREYIESIYFIVTDSAASVSAIQEKVVLRDVESIEFHSNKTLLILKNGQSKLVLTEVFKNGVRGASYELLIGQIKDLSLDHKYPLFSLRMSIDGKPQMKKLSDMALEYLKNHSDIKKSELDRCLSTLEILNERCFDLKKDKLCEELFEFLSQTELVIMDRSYNSSKNSDI